MVSRLGVCLAVAWVLVLPVQSLGEIGVFVLGDDIPDEGFLHYDPALSYRVVPFPTYEVAMSEDKAEAMARHVRMYLPRGEEGRYWEAFEKRWQFVIELPLLTWLGLSRSEYTEYKRHLMRHMVNSIMNGGVSLLAPPTRPKISNVLPFRGRMSSGGNCPECKPSVLERIDLLSGSLSRTSFSLVIGNSTPFDQFRGTGVEDYHDANLVLLGRPFTTTRMPISIQVNGTSKQRLEKAVREDPLALREGKVPWMLYCNVSHSKEYGKEWLQEAYANANGTVWACASFINGPFFFPRGGYATNSLMFNPFSPPRISKISLGEDHPYAWDIVSNMIYYSCGREIPDLQLAHSTRSLFGQYHKRYLDLLHVMDWAQKWREDPIETVLWKDLEQVEKTKVQATTLYIKGEYYRSRELIKRTLDHIARAEEHAKISLDDALAWIYLIETCIVTATGLIAGSITLYFITGSRTTKIEQTKLRHIRQEN